MNPVFNIDTFKAQFQAFACVEDWEISLSLRIAKSVYGVFCNVDCPEDRELMMMLAVAHTLEIETNPLLSGGAVKRIKSLNDEVEYARNASDNPFDLTITSYGSYLKKLMSLYGAGGVTSHGSHNHSNVLTSPTPYEDHFYYG